MFFVLFWFGFHSFSFVLFYQFYYPKPSVSPDSSLSVWDIDSLSLLIIPWGWGPRVPCCWLYPWLQAAAEDLQEEIKGSNVFSHGLTHSISCKMDCMLNPLTHCLSFWDTSVLPSQHNYTAVGSLDCNLELIIPFWGRPRKQILTTVVTVSVNTVSELSLLFSLFMHSADQLLVGLSQRMSTEAWAQLRSSAVCCLVMMAVPWPLFSNPITLWESHMFKERRGICFVPEWKDIAKWN